MKTLIVDDDAMTRLLLRSALTKLGHEVQEATNGREAWETWQDGAFPLVISDWMMPGLDGLEFCRLLRAGHRSEFSYVILLTSRTGKINFLEAMTAGADDFITKPFERDELSARVHVAERIVGLHAHLSAANSELEQRVLERTADLESALRVKGEFLSRASHELRTPLNHVLGHAQLLEMDELNGPQTESVQEILRGGHRLLEMIDRILEVGITSPDDLSFLGAVKLPVQAPIPSLQARQPSSL